MFLVLRLLGIIVVSMALVIAWDISIEDLGFLRVIVGVSCVNFFGWLVYGTKG